MTQSPPIQHYRPLYKPNQVLCGTGLTVIVTGWTVKQAVAKHLKPEDYAAIGQLYSPTRGISVLIRNLLANPQVQSLVIINATREDQNSGACQCLADFFSHGFTYEEGDRPHWRIQSDIPGFIDAEIPHDALELVRQSIRWRMEHTLPEAIQTIKHLVSQQIPINHHHPLVFPSTEPEASVLPGRLYGHVIEGETIADTWIKLIHRVKTTGTIRATAHDSQWQELIDVVAIVTDEPDGFSFPDPNYLPVSREFLQSYVAQVCEDAPKQEGVKYTYGQRLRSWFGRDQIQQVIDKLATDLDSSRAVMSLWDVLDHETGDSPPCLNHIWLRVVNGELSLTATFRSNDMFSAWPANAFGLRALQQLICQGITDRGMPLAMGVLIIISQSAHIYDDCWDNADRVIATHYSKLCQKRTYSDPAGSFVITVKQDSILVEHLTPGSGEVVNCYNADSAVKLYQQIAADCPNLQTEHALYLGTELQKADLALQYPDRITYHQDKRLKF